MAILHWQGMRIKRGQSFYKMSGSGNDFIFFDGRTGSLGALESASSIIRLCARGIGIGADGVVALVARENADIGLRYYNAGRI